VRIVKTYGLIEPDERLQTRVIARFPGRLDVLHVRSAGETVKQGQPLAEIYSPEFYAAANEYLIAWRGVQRAGDAGPEGERAKSLLGISRQRLRLAGFTDEQFKEIETTGKVGDHITLYAPASGTVVERGVVEGEMLTDGTPLFTIVDFSRVWIQAQVIESEVGAIKPGMPAEVTLVAWPGEIFRGEVDFIYPTLTPESRTLKVRVVVDSPQGRLKPGMYATVAFHAPLGRQELATAEEVETHRQQSAAEAGKPKFWCPMHHEVQSETMIDCPKCGMHLEEVPDDEWAEELEAGGVKSEISLSSDTLTSGTAHWSYGWSCAMHPEELEPKPGVCTTCGCGMKLEPYRIEGVLTVPEQGVIDTGARKIVYTEATPGIYDAREVVLGARVGEWYQVLQGLEAGQRIVARGSFLIDAEARLNPARATE
jgi:membrane fusion protein, copper/silver efflux system